MSVAAEEGHEALVELPVSRDDVDANSTDCCRLRHCCGLLQEGHEAMVELPMDRNDVDVNRTGLGGDTSLHSAAARGGHEAVGEISVDWGGVNVDSRDVRGNTPSSEAARDGHRKAVEILLERRVDLNAKRVSRQPLCSGSLSRTTMR